MKSQKFIKQMREQHSRKEQSYSLSGLWDTIYEHNPNIEREGMNSNGEKGLKRLKSNNIDSDIAEAGFRPLEVNKEVAVDLITIMFRQLAAICRKEVEAHQKAGRWTEAQQLSQEVAAVGTWLDRPRPSIWEAIPGLEKKMERRVLRERRKNLARRS